MINQSVRDKAEELHGQFENAQPFRHVVVDDFLQTSIAERMLSEFPSITDISALVNEFGVHNPKSAISDVREIGPVYAEMDDYIQSPEFLELMSKITGIPDLEYDPWYYGAGTHENFHGAGLDAHYDFNIHPRNGQHRRLNAIVYLNKDWDPEWKGSINFHTDPWDLEHDRQTEITPEFNRCVIFETNERSWHSVPLIDLPSDKRHLSRKSFTIYLYTKTRPAEETAPEHGTVYVQGGLPDRIREGRTLDAQDVAVINSNLSRRQEYLRAMYQREYRFSQVIENLKLQLDEWKQHSNVPLFGKAKVTSVSSPLFTDGWMGKSLSFTMHLRQDVSEVVANVWYPGSESPGITLTLSVNGSKTEVPLKGGVARVSLDVDLTEGSTVAVELSADRTHRASGTDLRDLSVTVDSVELY